MKEMKKINGDEPATQAELAMWGGRLAERIDGLGTRMDRVKADVADIKHTMATKDDLKQVRSETRQFKDEIIRHFDVVAENIHQDVAGANRDEISSLKDTDTKLHERVTVVENRLGIPTPPSS